MSWFLNCSERLEILRPGTPHPEGQSCTESQAKDGANCCVGREFSRRVGDGIAVGLLEVMLHVLFRELSELMAGIFTGDGERFERHVGPGVVSKYVYSESNEAIGA